jgi:hypothetical protein
VPVAASNVRTAACAADPSMPTPASLVRSTLTTPLLFVAALVLLFEEWFWERSNAGFARLAALPVLRSAERWTRARPRGQALALFLLPLVVIYPCKVVALLAVGAGYVTVGLAAFIVAKLVATALFARLYRLTEPAIVQFKCVRVCRDRFLQMRRYIHHWLNLRPAYRRARCRLRGQSARIARRYRAVYRLQHQRRCAALRHRRLASAWNPIARRALTPPR